MAGKEAEVGEEGGKKPARWEAFWRLEVARTLRSRPAATGGAVVIYGDWKSPAHCEVALRRLGRAVVIYGNWKSPAHCEVALRRLGRAVVIYGDWKSPVHCEVALRRLGRAVVIYGDWKSPAHCEVPLRGLEVACPVRSVPATGETLGFGLGGVRGRLLGWSALNPPYDKYWGTRARG